MVKIESKCAACGVPLELAVAEEFKGAGIAASLCPGCMDQAFLDGGGAILLLPNGPDGARFPLGKGTITVGAVEALADVGQHAASFLVRHAGGDWGKHGRFDHIDLTDDEQRRGWAATDDSGKINKSNVLNRRGRVMSEYATARARRLWVISNWGGGTTVLLPEEY